MAYLLGTQTLLDVAKGKGAAYEWFYGRAAQPNLFPDDVVISAFSVALIETHFREHPPKNTKQSTQMTNVLGLIKQFALDGAIVGASPKVIEYWSERLNFDIQYPTPQDAHQLLGFEEKIVLATAKLGNEGRGYQLVDRKQPIHDDLGLLIHDPY